MGAPVPPSPLRAAISAATRPAEVDCVPPLIAEATLPSDRAADVAAQARRLIEALRAKGQRSLVEALIREYALSTQEGVALMCVAEALLRIPDRETRDALIRDKLGFGDWLAHVHHSPSLFVNAATWGLVITGRLVATRSDASLWSALTRLVARGGEPLIRAGLDIAMRLLGEQFVAGETIAEALGHGRRMEAKGYRLSYDMLGEAAMTAADAARYFDAYEEAIHAIGDDAHGRGIREGPGISIKLSALHPRYARAQRRRVMTELVPRVARLAAVARRHRIGLNIDAEEADRLELSLDVLEALCFDPALAGWDGIGFVIQAYQKRCPAVVDYLVDLGRRSGHRLMVRLVKGAYWDSEIKRAQVDGLDGFPVFTRKIYTDVCYLACARRLLAAPDAVFPQFATHNAQTVAAVLAMAGGAGADYEFQCLHGMGEPLYDEIVGPAKLGRPCRIYAPVGTHETLLAYLVRRLLENGANSSFVHRVADPDVPIDDLIADPVAQARGIDPPGAPHPGIALPRQLFPDGRRNSRGLDLASDSELAALAGRLAATARLPLRAAPLLGDGDEEAGAGRPVCNPADHRDVVGEVSDATAATVARALVAAEAAAAGWAATSAADRAGCLLRAAELMQARMPELMGVIVREAGRTLPDSVSEVREAVDFLRYYAGQARDGLAGPEHRPLGPVVCISPWNFPLAIFTGQLAAALAAGNPVIAKPAEETPLVARLAVAVLREAGVPAGALQLLPGDGSVGAALVAAPGTQGVMFTGSTDVARRINAALAERLGRDGRPVPLIAETGGQNAMIVDSSALPEQVVADVLLSAFASAGQRCSSLRVLCLQEDVAGPVLTMLKGALAELAVGDPQHLSTDVGPIITADAQASILEHVAAMRAAGRPVHQPPLPRACRQGTFVPPTIIEIAGMAELKREVFGPVLHVLRYRRDGLDALIAAINATGYALTFGLHTRIDETIAHVTGRIAAGNIYINRNIIGAVVGMQPFGGHVLSGTGPKAGGPLYLWRLLRPAAPLPSPAPLGNVAANAALHWVAWLRRTGAPAAAACAGLLAAVPPLAPATLAGPAGERNIYGPTRRAGVLCRAASAAGLHLQVTAALATGERAVLDIPPGLEAELAGLPDALRAQVRLARELPDASVEVALVEAVADELTSFSQALARRPGPIVPVWRALPDDLSSGAVPLALLMAERSLSTNTAAAGGNASLMALA
ncbi:bifunctional protein PutA [Chelatococcus reniformis]|uniref:Bifunctional protein PutA n=2 Tax=Chelatococcus reniformis TaxID=1494448 RepID=A0A916X6U5_9HYPH|nr:bifunctional protein PutA [Chelatococcus reniformis]